jgi:hypothetical protein
MKTKQKTESENQKKKQGTIKGISPDRALLSSGSFSHENQFSRWLDHDGLPVLPGLQSPQRDDWLNQVMRIHGNQNAQRIFRFPLSRAPKPKKEGEEDILPTSKEILNPTQEPGEWKVVIKPEDADFWSKLRGEIREKLNDWVTDVYKDTIDQFETYLRKEAKTGWKPVFYSAIRTGIGYIPVVGGYSGFVIESLGEVMKAMESEGSAPNFEEFMAKIRKTDSEVRSKLRSKTLTRLDKKAGEDPATESEMIEFRKQVLEEEKTEIKKLPTENQCMQPFILAWVQSGSKQKEFSDLKSDWYQPGILHVKCQYEAQPSAESKLEAKTKPPKTPLPPNGLVQWTGKGNAYITFKDLKRPEGAVAAFKYAFPPDTYLDELPFVLHVEVNQLGSFSWDYLKDAGKGKTFEAVGGIPSKPDKTFDFENWWFKKPWMSGNRPRVKDLEIVTD